MFTKIALVIILLFCVVMDSDAKMVRFATDEQVEKYCVELLLKVDNDMHPLYYRHIKFFNEKGVTILYGKGLVKSYVIPKDEILNYREAKQKFEKLKRELP